ncbi:GGDEF domain-containing protein [Desulfocurvus sp.]|uniref:GGDEF domain-containing protein n=1 Tax=Desulfocurvus sp. TaxID=2871698 RepID=UPI0025BB4B45|nr:GGDEF domain-containing protein [Desulfocurvus sp.]MCK9239440.1 GGDEF domain-containing protein [Desulfocurvus sp.]
MIRLLSFAAAPLAMLALAWGVLVWSRVVPAQAVGWSAWGAMLAALLACWRFRRTRVVLPLGLLALTLWVCGLFGSGGPAGGLGRVVVPALALLLPLNWLAASLAGDRGVLGRVPLTLAFLVSLQALVVLLVATGVLDGSTPGRPGALQALVRDAALWSPLPRALPVRLPQLAQLGAAVVAAWLLLRAARRDSPMDAGLAVALAGTMGVLHFADFDPRAGALAAGAALACAAPLAQDSYRMAFLDELTRLPGRRPLLADMQTLGGRYAIAMGDVDHFKKFNDTYGHDIGDEVLRMVAAQLGRVGGGGRAYRYGGEEFAILFPRREPAEALEHLDAVREAIAGAGFVVRSDKPAPPPGGAERRKGRAGAARGGRAKAPGTVTVTISLGVAGPGSGGAATPAEVLKQADKALYKAKKNGRNRVEKA